MKQYFRILAILILISFFGQSLKACRCSNRRDIDSLAEMNHYEFIAHVKIINDENYKNPNESSIHTIGQLTFEIIELFKGERINKVLEDSKDSSCDIGVESGEEWVLFGIIIHGNITIVPCDRNQRYKGIDGQRDWKYDQGFYELRQLRKLYNHPTDKFENAKRKEFYQNGQIEIEQNYLNGKLDGERRIWYPSGKLFCKQFYLNDSLDGKSEWFYESGQIYDEDYFQKGKPINVSRFYFDSTIEKNWKELLIRDFYETEDSLNFVYNRIQARYETVFDSYGRAIISREYNRIGKIQYEQIADYDRNFRTTIYYHDNGLVSSIMYSLNQVEFGHYQAYDKNGVPTHGWDYDEKGKRIQNK